MRASTGKKLKSPPATQAGKNKTTDREIISLQKLSPKFFSEIAHVSLLVG